MGIYERTQRRSPDDRLVERFTRRESSARRARRIARKRVSREVARIVRHLFGVQPTHTQQTEAAMKKRKVTTRAKRAKDVAAGQRAAKIARVDDRIKRYKGKLAKYEAKLADAEAVKAELLKPPKVKGTKDADTAEPATRRKLRRAA